MIIKSDKLEKTAFINGKIYHPSKNKIIAGNIIAQDGILKDLNYKGSLEDFKVIDCKNKILSPGFLDIRSHFREPGEEDKETFKTGANAALAGGFTKICVMPNTNPVLDNPEVVDSIMKKSEDLGINIFPIGSISKQMEGKECLRVRKNV